MKKHLLTGATLVLILNATAAYSFSLISENQIVPTTDLPTFSFGGVAFTVDQIADGITADTPPFNGFASTETSGTITLDLVGNFNLNSFILWNDINVFQEGIRDFRLDFFDETDSLISSSPTFTAQQSQISQQEFTFSQVISDISRVNLVVIDSYISSNSVNQIEIREVAFTGSSTAIPEPLTILGTLTVASFFPLLKKQKQ